MRLNSEYYSSIKNPNKQEFGQIIFNYISIYLPCDFREIYKYIVNPLGFKT